MCNSKCFVLISYLSLMKVKSYCKFFATSFWHFFVHLLMFFFIFPLFEKDKYEGMRHKKCVNKQLQYNITYYIYIFWCQCLPISNNSCNTLGENFVSAVDSLGAQVWCYHPFFCKISVKKGWPIWGSIIV